MSIISEDELQSVDISVYEACLTRLKDTKPVKVVFYYTCTSPHENWFKKFLEKDNKEWFGI